MQKGDNNNSDSSVKVFIRVRPLISIQENSHNIVSIGADEQSVVIFIDEYNQIETKFDKIVSSLKNQKQMFMNVRPFIQKILDGYNFTIFAYGQTGSGKTYTMFGKDWQNNFAELEKSKKSIKQNTPLTDVTSDDNFAGIIPRSTYHIFSCLLGNPGGYNVYCSFLQIYNQKVYDLLQDTPIPNPLNIHESKFEGIFVQGLGEFKVEQYTDCLQLIRRGQKNRFIRQTSMNAKSSRSHTIFQIIIQSTRPNAHGEYTRARMNLCDLAGSEKINKIEHMKKEHLDQLKNINLSLTTLGKVINALSKGLNKNLAFFRQSKLTRLLQQSLVGNTNTIIVGAISPSSKNKQQTLNTLKFVERAKHIKLKIKPSSISNQSGDLVNRLQEQMEQLRRILMEKEKNKVPKQIEQKLYQLQQQNHTLKNQTSNKNENIYALIEQNRKMKQALNRMQKVAIEQLSNASFLLSEADSHKMSYRLSHKQKMKQTDRFDELQSSFKFNTIPRYQDQGTPPRKQFLPPISSRLNRSLNVIPESDISRPAMVIDDRGRKNIINKFQQIQLAKKRKQNKLINELDPILINQQQKSSQIRSQSTNSKHPIATHSTIQQDSLRGKSKKKPNFADKIKQLEARLKNSKK